MEEEPFVWQGDLDDNCHCVWKGLQAHAEDMDDGWYCSVRSGDQKQLEREGDLFHTSDADILPLTGVAARWLCECLMRLILAGRYQLPPAMKAYREPEGTELGNEEGQ
jgi:hypothetical protein